jgi:hypothetical protein
VSEWNEEIKTMLRLTATIIKASVCALGLMHKLDFEAFKMTLMKKKTLVTAGALDVVKYTVICTARRSEARFPESKEGSYS